MRSSSTTTPQASPPSGGPIHVAYLDGLRALAALWVLLGHARLFTLGWKAQTGVFGLLTNGASYMHFAVDIFIVLSGYCLTLPVLRRGDKTESITRFLWKRARRILPPYYAAVLLCLLIDAVVPLETWMRNSPAYHTQDMPSSILLTHLFVLQDYFQQYNLINGPFWSIAVEWHIYLIFPAIALMLRKWSGYAAFIFTAVVAAAAMTYSAHVHPMNSPYFALLFGMGVLSAWLGRTGTGSKWRIDAATLVFVVWAFVTVLLVHHYPIADLKTCGVSYDHAVVIDPTIGALTASGLLLLGMGGSRHRRTRLVYQFLSWRPLAALGVMSYSLYLVHLPVLAVAKHLIDKHLPEMHPTMQFAIFATGGTALCIVCSYLFFLAVERPFLVRHRRETPSELARDAVLSPGI